MRRFLAAIALLAVLALPAAVAVDADGSAGGGNPVQRALERHWPTRAGGTVLTARKGGSPRAEASGWPTARGA